MLYAVKLMCDLTVRKVTEEDWRRNGRNMLIAVGASYIPLVRLPILSFMYSALFECAAITPSVTAAETCMHKLRQVRCCSKVRNSNRDDQMDVNIPLRCPLQLAHQPLAP